MFNTGQDEGSNNVKRSSSFKKNSTIAFFALLFAPVVAFWWFCYERMFKKYRLRPRYPIGLSILVSFLSFWLLIPQQGYIPGFMDNYTYTGISGTIDFISSANIGIISVLWYVISRLWLIGFMLSFIIIIASVLNGVHFIKTNPSHKALEDEWAYNWSYKRTIPEFFRRKSRIKKLVNGQAYKKDMAPLGIAVSDDYRDDYVSRHVKEANQHTFITGNTGSGKTMTTLALIKSDVLNGIPVVMQDFKRDSSVAVKLAKFAHDSNVPFYHFLDTPAHEYKVPYSDGPCVYNPFINAGNGTPDMLVGMRQYTAESDVYKQSVMELSQAIYKMLRITDRKYLYFDGVNGKKPAIRFDKGDIYVWLDCLRYPDILLYGYTQTLKEKGLPHDDQMANDVSAMRKPSTQLNVALNSVKGQLITMTSSGYGEYFDSSSDHRVIDIYELTQQPCVILFSMDGNGQKSFSSSLGSLIFQDLSNISTKRNREDTRDLPLHVYADEFQIVPPDSITDLVEKSRSANMGMTFISQSLSQIVSGASKDGESLLLGLMDSASNFIIHAGSTQQSAEKYAEIAGKKMQAKYSKRNSINSTLFSINYFSKKDQDIVSTMEEDWIYQPELFSTLRGPNVDEKGNFNIGTAVMINRNPYGIKTPHVLARKFETYIDADVTSKDEHEDEALGESTETLSLTEAERLAEKETEELVSHNVSHKSKNTEFSLNTNDFNTTINENNKPKKKVKRVKKVVKKQSNNSEGVSSNKQGLPKNATMRTQRMRENNDNPVNSASNGSQGFHGTQINRNDSVDDGFDLDDIMSDTKQNILKDNTDINSEKTNGYNTIEDKKQEILNRFKK